MRMEIGLGFGEVSCDLWDFGRVIFDDGGGEIFHQFEGMFCGDIHKLSNARAGVGKVSGFIANYFV